MIHIQISVQSSLITTLTTFSTLLAFYVLISAIEADNPCLLTSSIVCSAQISTVAHVVADQDGRDLTITGADVHEAKKQASEDVEDVAFFHYNFVRLPQWSYKKLQGPLGTENALVMQ